MMDTEEVDTSGVCQMGLAAVAVSLQGHFRYPVASQPFSDAP